MAKRFLAVDLGASSGRHIIGTNENGIIRIEEIYRFPTGMDKKGDRLVWNVDRIFGEIKKGMRVCAEKGLIPDAMAIDTWGVDFVLLDENDRVLGETFGYRDVRTTGMDDEVYRILPESALYARTGIQKQIFNTIYQLTAVKKQTPALLEKAKTFLMMPDYLEFLLTGRKHSEYTDATTSQLVDPEKKDWDRELITMLGLPESIFLPLEKPGTFAGRLRPETAKEVGFDCDVLLCPSHDTASAVLAMPDPTGKGLYISSGTWSLMGVESEKVLADEKSHAANFTNEGGIDYRFRYLKNIMGLWMIQSARHELNDAYSFNELDAETEKCLAFPSRVDVNDGRFFAPDSMIGAVKDYCREHGEKVPESVGEIFAVINLSLADCYAKTVREIARNTGRSFDRISIFGGGSQSVLLNRLTAKATGLKVFAGPSEATAIGNIASQMLAKGEFSSLSEVRSAIRDSFSVKEYSAE